MSWVRPISMVLKFIPDLALSLSCLNSGSRGCCLDISSQSMLRSPTAAMTQFRSVSEASFFASAAARLATQDGSSPGVAGSMLVGLDFVVATSLSVLSEFDAFRTIGSEGSASEIDEVVERPDVAGVEPAVVLEDPMCLLVLRLGTVDVAVCIAELGGRSGWLVGSEFGSFWSSRLKTELTS